MIDSNLFPLGAIQTLLGADEETLYKLRCTDCFLGHGVLPSESAAIVSLFLTGICKTQIIGERNILM